MAHFAKVLNGTVINVIVAEESFFETFIDNSPGSWIQTSYNTRGGIHYNPETGNPDGGVALRKNYAGVGYTYDAVKDAFIAPKPYTSWLLDEETCLWYPPVEKPDDGGIYIWNEQKYYNNENPWDEIE